MYEILQQFYMRVNIYVLVDASLFGMVKLKRPIGLEGSYERPCLCGPLITSGSAHNGPTRSLVHYYNSPNSDWLIDYEQGHEWSLEQGKVTSAMSWAIGMKYKFRHF